MTPDPSNTNTDGLQWRVVSATAPGTSHTERNLPCQDAQQHCLLPGGILIAAVADGLGSAERSEEGAALAVRAVTSEWQTLLTERQPTSDDEWEQTAREICVNAREVIASHAKAANCDIRKYATTLSFVICAFGKVVTGQIGDGFIVAQNAQGQIKILAQPQRGEFANEVTPLTSSDAIASIQVSVCIDDLGAICLSTDGMLRLALKLPRCEPFPRFFLPLWEFTRTVETEAVGSAQLATFLASQRVTDLTEDDKALIVATRVDHA